MGSEQRSSGFHWEKLPDTAARPLPWHCKRTGQSWRDAHQTKPGGGEGLISPGSITTYSALSARASSRASSSHTYLLFLWCQGNIALCIKLELILCCKDKRKTHRDAAANSPSSLTLYPGPSLCRARTTSLLRGSLNRYTAAICPWYTVPAVDAGVLPRKHLSNTWT